MVSNRATHHILAYNGECLKRDESMQFKKQKT